MVLQSLTPTPNRDLLAPNRSKTGSLNLNFAVKQAAEPALTGQPPSQSISVTKSRDNYYIDKTQLLNGLQTYEIALIRQHTTSRSQILEC